jgi:peptide/nickel transport system substrate-binding protein
MRRGREASTGRRRGRAARVISLVAALAWLPPAGCAPLERAPDTVVYASGSDLESLNPLITIHGLSRQVQRHALYVTLARMDATLAATPYLARGWTWSADRRALTFVIDPGLRWHDGAATTTRDVAFTLDAARDPSTGYPRAGDLASLTAVEAPDDTTIVLRFAGPQASFPQVLTELPIVPAHRLSGVPRAAMRGASFERTPVGNGPFRFVDRKPGQRWVFERNDDFPPALGGPPAIRRLVIAVVDEATTKFAGLVSGSLDVAGIAPSMAALAARDRAIRVIDYPLLFLNALIFNPHRAPFDDARVRRALHLSLDRERIIEAALAGYATPAAGPVSPDNPLAAPAAPARDTALADSLLDAAGWTRDASGRRVRGGAPFEFTLLTVGAGDNAVEQLVQADLAARGLRMEIRQLELGAFLAEARSADKRFDALLTGIPGDLSLAYLAAMYDARQAGGALDYAGFHTPALDSSFAAVRSATDTGGVRRAWSAVQEELAREMPAAWLYHARGVQGISRRLHGVTMDLRGEMATLSEWRAGEPAVADRR